MAKVFISLFSNIDDPNNVHPVPYFYETIISKLQELGNSVYVYISKDFAKDYTKINQDIKKSIADFNPDLCILFNNTFYDISNIVDCPIVVYEVDSPIFYSNKNNLKNNIDRYKFIVVQDSSITLLNSEFKANKKNIIKIPFFSEIHSENVPFKNNICFIGTKFPAITPYRTFMNENPDEKDIDLYKGLIEDFNKNPLISNAVFWQKHSDLPEIIKNKFDFISIMSGLSDYNRTMALSAVADLGLDLYGSKEWITDNYNNPLLMLSYKNKVVYSKQHNQDIYNACKIGININHLQAVSAFSWRVCDIMASNACLVSEYKPDIEKQFHGIIPTFSNPYEAREICKRLLKNENERRDIVAASNEIIDRNYRLKNILPWIEDFTGIILHSTKKGPQPIKYYVEKNKIASNFETTCKLGIYGLALLLSEIPIGNLLIKEDKILNKIAKYSKIRKESL